jgi:hypothetical protein
MQSCSAVKHWNTKVVLAALMIWLVSCKGTGIAQSAATITPGANTAPAMAKTPLPVFTPRPTLTPPESFGLFVEMQDGDNSSPHGNLKPRVYHFNANEPITLTAVMLVFGKGGLEIGTGIGFPMYAITVVNEELGQPVAITPEGEAAIANWYARGIKALHFTVDQREPFIESFQIDKWFQFTAGYYTLTLARKSIWISGKEHEVTGNSVRFAIGRP